MKKQLASLDLHFIAEEFQVLKDTRVDKIYQPEKDIIILSLHKANIGKKLLKIIIGQSVLLIDEKEDFGETLGFGMLLRKHIDGYFLYEFIKNPSFLQIYTIP
jgi:predicted ribosome quality control (RQC) complex YloA/Tae2 family protein